MASNQLPVRFWKIIQMNIGFFGLQYSFGLQQANMSPIYSYLGADESKLPYLWLAGPITGLIVQPIVGAFSDRTNSRFGRRTPYFFIGALLSSLCLLVMPFSSSVWMAASVLWILDAANNITQEPYRAFVGDQLSSDQQPTGFLTQSAFTGLGQTLSYLTPTLLIYFGVSKDAHNERGIPYTTMIAFMIGAVMSIGTMVWSILASREKPIPPDEWKTIQAAHQGEGNAWSGILAAFREMPSAMKRMIPMMFFSWYALFTYWIYITPALAKHLYQAEPGSPGFREAELLASQLGATYNAIAFGVAFLLVALARYMAVRWLHAICLVLAGVGLFVLPLLPSSGWMFVPMIGMGACWASMMGSPYVMLSSHVPAARNGVYLGIFNMFIVIPMLIQNVTMPLYYQSWLGGNPTTAIQLAGVLLVLASIATLVWVPGAQRRLHSL